MSKFRQYDNYEIYEDGRIWSYKSKKWLKPSTNNKGYQLVTLSDNEGKQKKYLLHRIVYETFSGSPIPNNLQCNHISEDKMDNRFCNINLMTCKQNLNYGTRNLRAGKSLTKVLTNNKKLSKVVGAFKDGKLIFTFPSTQEAKRQGFCSSAIVRCCNGKRKTHKGFEWRYI